MFLLRSHFNYHSLKSLAFTKIFMSTAPAFVSPSQVSTAMIPRLLSIQSHTVHGYVGNKAATFPLQCLGFNVDAVNTITLSNHPAYKGGFKGRSMEATALQELVEGLSGNDLLRYDAVLSGYSRSEDLLLQTAAAVNLVRVANPDAMYVCDPVLGDNGRFYVPESLVDCYKNVLLPLATVATPNQFEAEVLSGRPVRTVMDALLACDAFHTLGVEICVLTGLTLEDGSFSMVVSHWDKNKKSESSIVKTVFCVPLRRIGDRTFSGCGDLMTAALTAHLYGHRMEYTQPSSSTSTSSGSNGSNSGSETCVRSGDGSAWVARSVEESVRLVERVLADTERRGSKELCVIENAELFISARHRHTLAHSLTTASLSSAASQLTEKNSHTFKAAVTTQFESSISHRIAGGICGVIFDMDGTLTEPGAIDFNNMYRRAGVVRDPELGDILAQIRSLPDPESRRKARQVVVEEELKACDKLIPRRGLRELLHELRVRRVRLAIATRNCQEALEHFLETTALSADMFTHLLHRESIPDGPPSTQQNADPEDRVFVNKPDGRVASYVLDHWSVPSQLFTSADGSSVLFVGDSLDDMLCGRRAGCRTCLLRTPDNGSVLANHSSVVDVCVDSLEQVLQLIVESH